MTIAEAPTGSGSAIFSLIAPFSESTDARLRGNAVQALAALVGGEDKGLRQQAVEEIVRVMSAEPGGSGALDWQRRFSARCLEALARLQPADRQLVGQQILATSFSVRERERRVAIARLNLAAMEHDRRFWTAGWMGWLRLLRLAIRPGFWLTVWAALWRTAVVWVILMLAMAAVFKFVLAPSVGPAGTFSDDLLQHFLWIGGLTAAIFTVSALLSISGSIRPPLGICIADTFVSAIMLAILTILGVWVDLDPEFLGPTVSANVSVRDKLSLCILGFVLGAAIRALRWVAVAVETEPNGTAVGFRPLAALGVTTLACIIASWLGMDISAAATGWIILTPATIIAAWLDVWLENSEPHPLAQIRAHADSRWTWATPMVAALAILLSGYLVGSNLKNGSSKYAALQSLGAGEVQLPGSSGSPSTSTAEFGHQIRLRGDVEGSYQFIVKTDASEQITLILVQDGPGPDRHVVDRSSSNPPTITGQLEKGAKYFLCVMPEDESSCSLTGVANVRNFDMLVLNGDIRPKIDVRAAHTINISRSP
jgi:hypothetical protein